MALEESQKIAYQTSATEAVTKLRLMIEKMSPEEREGAAVVINWYKASYQKATYKYLGLELKTLSV